MKIIAILLLAVNCFGSTLIYSNDNGGVVVQSNVTIIQDGYGMANLKNVTNSVTAYRSGVTNIPTLAVSQDVLFTTPLLNANYTPQAVSMFYLATVTFSYSNVTSNGFRVNLSTGVAGGGEIRFFGFPYN